MYCVNCGTTITQTENMSGINTPNSPPIPIPDTQQQIHYGTSDSVETSVLNVHQLNQSQANFNPVPPLHENVQPNAGRRNWFLLLGIPLMIFLAVGAGTFYLLMKQQKAETLPEHFGFFIQADKSGLNELKKQDTTNLLDAKDELLKKDDLPDIGNNPNWILYAENNDIPLNDLKLIELNSITDKGEIKQLDFQAAPVEGKSEMKKIRVPQGLASGKYAFAIFDGFLDEGKHKLWVFEVKESRKSANDELAKSISVALKPKEQKKPDVTPPKVPPPPGGQVAYVTQSRVLMRRGPTQASAVAGRFSRGQRVYVIEYSSNYETFNNLSSNFAFVQTESGKRGWIYAAFLR
jgi:hypothetical protein